MRKVKSVDKVKVSPLQENSSTEHHQYQPSFTLRRLRSSKKNLSSSSLSMNKEEHQQQPVSVRRNSSFNLLRSSSSFTLRRSRQHLSSSSVNKLESQSESQPESQPESLSARRNSSFNTLGPQQEPMPQALFEFSEIGGSKEVSKEQSSSSDLMDSMTTCPLTISQTSSMMSDQLTVAADTAASDVARRPSGVARSIRSNSMRDSMGSTSGDDNNNTRSLRRFSQLSQRSLGGGEGGQGLPSMTTVSEVDCSNGMGGLRRSGHLKDNTNMANPMAQFQLQRLSSIGGDSVTSSSNGNYGEGTSATAASNRGGVSHTPMSPLLHRMSNSDGLHKFSAPMRTTVLNSSITSVDMMSRRTSMASGLFSIASDDSSKEQLSQKSNGQQSHRSHGSQSQRSGGSQILYNPVRKVNRNSPFELNRNKPFNTLNAMASSNSSMYSANNTLVRTKMVEQAPPSFSSKGNPNHSPVLAPKNKMRPRRSSFITHHPLHATIVFVDIESYSRSSDDHQRQLTCDFMSTVRNLLTFAYDELPVRGNIDNYVILPTGDGAAVIVIQPPRRTICKHQKAAEFGSKHEHDCSGTELPHGITCEHCNSTCSSLRTTEETALWIGSSLLLWASQRQIGLRVGLNSGELSIVEDPYGDPNVCGDAINMAARIMDVALPGQILASATTVIPNLNVLAAEELAKVDLLEAYYEDGGQSSSPSSEGGSKKKGLEDCAHCPRIKYEISEQASEVVVKHGVTSNVQSITCALHLLPRPEDLSPELRSNPSSLLSVQDGSNTGDLLQPSSSRPSNPLSRLKKPAKQSFASLSSMAAASTNSLTRVLSRSSKGSNQDFSSASRRTPKEGRRNSSWKLSDSFTEKSGKPDDLMARLSMLSQLSIDDSNDQNVEGASRKTLPRSNVNGNSSNICQQRLTETALACLPQYVGNHSTPATKWYMKIKPTEMRESSKDDGQIKPKVLPQELIRRHKRIAFLGISHDNLARGFVKILEKDPSHRWDQVYILFPSDGCLTNHLVNNYKDQSAENLISNKRECCRTLSKVLSPVVSDLRILQYGELMHCGSYWDWEDLGGFIHISPVTWGANPKTCPAMNYYWNSKLPSPEYRVYRNGLDCLLDMAKPVDLKAGTDEENAVIS